MIEPNMATMLAFIATDAAISPALLDRALRASVERTFNSITVDGDTSTNDTVAVLANGHSGAREIRAQPALVTRVSCAALESICKSLALAIVEDGEGAQRVIEIEVRGAASERAADRIAKHDRQFSAREDGLRRRRSKLGPHPRRRRPLRREIRSRSA